MKIKEWTKSFVNNVSGGISRFKTAFVFSLIMFLLLSIDILWSIPSEWVGELYTAMPLGAFVSVLLTVVSEKTKLKKWIADALAVLTVFGCFYVTYFLQFTNDHFWTGYWGIILAAICFTVAALFNKTNWLILIPHLVKSLLFTLSVGAILSAGVSLCLWAFQVLVYDFDYEIFLVANLFIWVVLVVNLFLAYLPKNDEEIKLPKLFKIIVVNVALPIYILLMAILYVYMAKIIITRNMPVGQINWFASFATLFFVFFVFCVRQYEDNFIRLFTKLAGWFVIPVIIMQLVAIYERISAYGLTTPRTISLILVAVGIIFAVVSLLGKKIENVLWVVGIVILVFTLVPKINILEMPAASQVNLLEKYLVKNNMLADDQIIANAQIDDYDKERIRSAYNYLMRCEFELPEWIVRLDIDEFKTVFGFDRYVYAGSEGDYKYYYYSCGTEAGRFFDIAEYESMQFVSYRYGDDYPLFETNIDGQKHSFDMVEIFNNLTEQYGDTEIIQPITLTENLTLYFKYADCVFENNEISSISFEGYLFIK